MLYHLYRRISGDAEFGFHIETSVPLTPSELLMIEGCVAAGGLTAVSDAPFLESDDVVEIGPRRSVVSPWSSNTVAICHAMHLPQVTRFERMQRMRHNGQPVHAFLAQHLDRMTEEHYPNGIVTFDTGATPAPVEVIDIIGRGSVALEEANKRFGLSMDAEDIAYYSDYFAHSVRQNPTDVALYQVGNMNSEHCRHHRFNGLWVIDGMLQQKTLMQIIKEPLRCLTNDTTSKKSFNDNCGVFGSTAVNLLLPRSPGSPSEVILCKKVVSITITAETHNHPTAISPGPGAATGAGGEIRDDGSTGRGSLIGVGFAGYAVANLFLPGYHIPGEEVGRGKRWKYADPQTILIEGSNWVTMYNNQFGRACIGGFCRASGQRVRGQWRGWAKPILYSAGVGEIFEEHLEKQSPQPGMLIVRFGGPALRIGKGGGSASSMGQGENTEELDFDSVQRGNAEEENRANRVIETSTHLGVHNPIAAIQDQGAGGVGNAVTELVSPAGGRVDIRRVTLGDQTMSPSDIWVSEFQESYAALVWPADIGRFEEICKRERVICDVLGEVTGDGRMVVVDGNTGQTLVDLNLEHVLTHIPQKRYESTRQTTGDLPALTLPDVPLEKAIENVFAQLSVGSKGFLTHKGDRWVKGLTVQQQECGIAQIPIADVGVKLVSHFDTAGSATAIGEQPIKGLIDPAAGARMSLGEAITNIAPVVISDLGDVRCRVNVMCAAKQPHEGAALYDAETAVADLLIALGCAANGGKDSCSMTAEVEGEQVIAPGSIVVLASAFVPDVSQEVTPDVKKPGDSNLYLIDIGEGNNRLGGSAFAQAFGQLGNETPDVDNPKLLANSFRAVQQMISEGVILALHDRSDGGLIATVAEMCMASRCGFSVYVFDAATAWGHLFNEELGFVLEVLPENEHRMLEICKTFDIPCSLTGVTRDDTLCGVLSALDDEPLFAQDITQVRAWWERTSYEIEKLQMNPVCALEEYRGLTAPLPRMQDAPSYQLTFTPNLTAPAILSAETKPRVYIVREEGSNGDSEMRSAFHLAGFAAFDVAMSDLRSGRAALHTVQGIAFPGGFSYQDVLGSAVGWAATILSDEALREQFERFYARNGTFSLGVCNGNQLVQQLGWVPWKGIPEDKRPRLIRNKSGEGMRDGKFEARWVQVEVCTSPSIFFTGMAGSRLPVCIAHGEGQQIFPDALILQEVLRQNLVALRYVDAWGKPTEQYPENPNGSVGGITGFCTPDGRHTVMMPHPERCFRLDLLSWMPESWKGLAASPWLRMFQNARTWCEEHRA